MLAIIFLCIIKSYLFAMFVWTFTTNSLSIAEILLFIKKDGRKLPSPTLPMCIEWRQPLDGATDRGVVRLGSQHHLCGSKSVAYSSASLHACWWRTIWTSEQSGVQSEEPRRAGMVKIVPLTCSAVPSVNEWWGSLCIDGSDDDAD